MEQRYDHKISEPLTRQLWKDSGVYTPSENAGDTYIIDTPPPTVSGSLHIGHIFSYTQTDIIARYQRLQGKAVIYPFGFDDNGLPTERFVEKKAKIQAHKMSRSSFIELCLSQTKEVEEQFKELWQTIGLSAHWEHCYATISDKVRRLSQASFLDLLQKEYVYRRYEPALYCTSCRTSVAQAELDDAEIAATFNTILFTDLQGNSLPVATTRPELLPACVALFFNPNDTRYHHLRNSYVITPLFNEKIPVFEDSKVIPEKGTGLVMCCTFGDTTDIMWYKSFNLPFKQAIGLNGMFVKGTGVVEGLKVKDARVTIIAALKTAGLLQEQKDILHRVSVHERCKNEIEYTLLRQWFVRILDFKKEFIQLADQITWYPTFMKSRYINWVENLGWDWCISRQRFFGIPFPVWHCTSCNSTIPAQEDQLPIDPQEITCKISCPNCGSNDSAPDTDVMDTWNTSALTPYIVAEMVQGNTITFTTEKRAETTLLPLSMRPQAHDIIRTWAFYSITRSWMHNKVIPWKEIVISGHVLSDAKNKLSKSQGNAHISPDHLLKQYSADAIRYWTASAGLGHDVAFSDNQFKIGQKLITKLWNAFRFIETHTSSENIVTTELPPSLGIVNEWILHKTTHCFSRYIEQLNKYEFSAALNNIEHFFWHDWCDNYLEIIKDQLFKPEQYQEQEIVGTKWTLSYLGFYILQLYAPFVPFITEAIYQELYKQTIKKTSLHQTTYVAGYNSHHFSEAVFDMEQVLTIINVVRKLKSLHNLSLKTELRSLTIVSPHTTNVSRYDVLIRGVTGAQEILYQLDTLKQAQLIHEDNCWLAQVPL